MQMKLCETNRKCDTCTSKIKQQHSKYESQRVAINILCVKTEKKFWGGAHNLWYENHSKY